MSPKNHFKRFYSWEKTPGIFDVGNMLAGMAMTFAQSSCTKKQTTIWIQRIGDLGSET